MNLIDAIKSGRPYRRKIWGSAVNWRPALNRLIDKEAYSERLDDLLADDWEIQEPAVTITRAQFYAKPDDRDFASDSGGASRFFYVAKASRSDRNRKAKDAEQAPDCEAHQADELFDPAGNPARREGA